MSGLTLDERRKVRFCDNDSVYQGVASTYNTKFYDACQEGEEIVYDGTDCCACGKEIEKNGIFWSTVTEDGHTLYAKAPEQIMERGKWKWWSMWQGCGDFCAHCVTKYGKKTDIVKEMQVEMDRKCPVYWKKFIVKGSNNGPVSNNKSAAKLNNPYMVNFAPGTCINTSNTRDLKHSILKPGTIVQVKCDFFPASLELANVIKNVKISTEVNGKPQWRHAEADVQVPANCLCLVTAIYEHTEARHKLYADLILMKSSETGQVVKLEKVCLDLDMMDTLFARTNWTWNFNIIRKATEYGQEETIQQGQKNLQFDTEDCEYIQDWICYCFDVSEDGIYSRIYEDAYHMNIKQEVTVEED